LLPKNLYGTTSAFALVRLLVQLGLGFVAAPAAYFYALMNLFCCSRPWCFRLRQAKKRFCFPAIIKT
jgi:hypothetical protein